MLLTAIGDGTNTEGHVLTPAYFTPLPPQAEPPSACDSIAVNERGPFLRLSVDEVLACGVAPYASMNACIKAHPGVGGIGQMCKTLLAPKDRGNGKAPSRRSSRT